MEIMNLIRVHCRLAFTGTHHFIEVVSNQERRHRVQKWVDGAGGRLEADTAYFLNIYVNYSRSLSAVTVFRTTAGSAESGLD